MDSLKAWFTLAVNSADGRIPYFLAYRRYISPTDPFTWNSVPAASKNITCIEDLGMDLEWHYVIQSLGSTPVWQIQQHIEGKADALKLEPKRSTRNIEGIGWRVK